MAKTNAAAAAGHILAYATAQGIPLTNLKLQKLLYFCFGCYLARTGEALFDEPLEAWPKGPVQPDQWRRFNSFGKLPISVVEGAARLADSAAADILDETLNRYAPLDQWVLVQLSHGPAWTAARNGLPADQRSNALLDPSGVAAEFAATLLEQDAVREDPEDWPAVGETNEPADLVLTLSDADVAKLQERLDGVDMSNLRRFDRGELERRLGLSAKDAA